MKNKLPYVLLTVFFLSVVIMLVLPKDSPSIEKKDSFFLEKGETNFSLTSKYDGDGFGLILRNLTTLYPYNMTIKDAIEKYGDNSIYQISLFSFRFPNETSYFHLKKTNSSDLAKYEILTDIENTLFTIKFTVGKIYVRDSSSVGAIMEIDGGRGYFDHPELIGEDEIYYYYSITTNQLKVLKIINKDG